MIKLVPVVAAATLIELITGQFAFMKAMSRPGDFSYNKLMELDLNIIYTKAVGYFYTLVSYEDEIIEAEECNLTDKITEFLKEWDGIVDVTAIQQNIHYTLSKLN